jgi:hypothetical protein
MTNVTALNSEQHRDLRVVIKRGAEYGDNVHIVPVVADELRNLALEYPVILIKNKDSGRFEMVAMLGFDQGENLYLAGDQWDAIYVPVNIRRQPFALAYTAEKDGKPDLKSLVISLDMDSPRVGLEEGERLFNEDGTQTQFLEGANSILAGLGSTLASTEAFIEALQKHDLIKAAQIDVRFEDGKRRHFDGLHTVDDEKLNQLEGDVLQDMYKSGYLQGAWLLFASMGNIRKLFKRKTLRQ